MLQVSQSVTYSFICTHRERLRNKRRFFTQIFCIGIYERSFCWQKFYSVLFLSERNFDITKKSKFSKNSKNGSGNRIFKNRSKKQTYCKWFIIHPCLSLHEISTPFTIHYPFINFFLHANLKWILFLKSYITFHSEEILYSIFCIGIVEV